MSNESDLFTPRPIDEYHEDMGPVLWWWWEAEGNGLPGRWAGEPPYVGGPGDLGQTVEVIIRTHALPQGSVPFRAMVGGWPGYHTHFTPIPIPQVPK